MKEFALIAELTRSLPKNDTVVVGSGDDCAVLDLGLPDQFVLFKTDAVVEGMHFLTECEPEKIGRKALARCLSDIAAMGGAASSALVTIALPKKFDVEFVKRIYTGLNEIAAAHGLAIVGGETTTNPERVLISISLLGLVDKKKCILRSGAKVNDAIFVSGELGGSLAGRHLEFEPRLAEARWLAQNFQIHSMIDLSDGLASDLRHILHASKVGADILASAIPISRAAKLQARAESSSKPPLLSALTDGEDFELLFTVNTKDAVPLLDGWKKEFPKTKLSCIGKIIAGHSLKLHDKGGVRELSAKGYEHFA
ncbi:MAG: Thiamine-monophosphate kinase [Verrucomicrobiales bacterium]|nr:Thiamine-monophosphate kinase [Verrucomicrobiales bacterium]